MSHTAVPWKVIDEAEEILDHQNLNKNYKSQMATYRMRILILVCLRTNSPAVLLAVYLWFIAGIFM